MSELLDEYREFFRTLSDERFLPFRYQEEIASALWARKNVIVRAPTGSGKTQGVIAPFLFLRNSIGARRLIYALPLRSLAQSIYEEARSFCRRVSPSPNVTIQTGEQPDDPFFTFGDIIVTTYDQVLSGALCGPYGLPAKLHNINAAAVAGNLIVFDEFHLMDVDRAFLTGIACLHLLRDVNRCVWMTATATSPLINVLSRALECVDIAVPEDEISSLPNVAGVTRYILKESQDLSPDSVLRCHQRRSLVIANQVKRAQALYEGILGLTSQAGIDVPITLLHSKFFAPDRAAKQRTLRQAFGKGSSGRGILIATQVIEAGLDITCEHLHTEICPMNALVQRAGRCARFRGEQGTVHVYRTQDGSPLPYEAKELDAAWKLLSELKLESHPKLFSDWVECAHRQTDETALRQGWRARLRDAKERIGDTIRRQACGGVAHFIREQSDTVRVIVHDSPFGISAGEFEGIPVFRNQLNQMLSKCRPIGWAYNPEVPEKWIEIRSSEEIKGSYAVCLRTAIAKYTSAIGLELGVSGIEVSPRRILPKRPGYKPLAKEKWSKHTGNVQATLLARLDLEVNRDGLLSRAFGREKLQKLASATAILHDFGKLQKRWQDWAEAYQKLKDPEYVHQSLLAHTDFDYANRRDLEIAKAVPFARPHHSAASTFYGANLLDSIIPCASAGERAACLAAVLGHHGGWSEGNLLELHPMWSETVRELSSHMAGSLMYPMPVPNAAAIERLFMRLGEQTADLDGWWPLAAYLTRTLRLADQKATEEGSQDN